MAVPLQRQVFEISRAAEYFTVREPAFKEHVGQVGEALAGLGLLKGEGHE